MFISPFNINYDRKKRSTSVTNEFINITPNQIIDMCDNIVLRFKYVPSKGSLIVFQFDVEENCTEFDKKIDMSDTIFIYELNPKSSVLSLSTDEFWTFVYTLNPKKTLQILVNVLLLTVNDKFEEHVDTIMPLIFKFERNQ